MGVVYRNGRPYLYRSMRRGGRVTSQYLASGADALLITALEADERDWQRLDRERIRSERKEHDDVEQALDDLAGRARDLAAAALRAAGYHQHHRGEWRKRRVSRHRESEVQRADDGQLGDQQLIDWAAGKKGNEQTKASLMEELTEVSRRAGRPEPDAGREGARRDRRNVMVRLPNAEGHYIAGANRTGE